MNAQERIPGVDKITPEIFSKGVCGKIGPKPETKPDPRTKNARNFQAPKLFTKLQTF